VVDVDTFLTWLYVTADDWVKREWAPQARPGPAPALSVSEVVTLAVFGQWAGFASERAFYRFAARRLRAAFPTLPDRSQFNRRLRAQWSTIVAFGQALAAQDARSAAYQALDATAVPVRNAKRRGTGWLPGTVALGRSTSLGWYEGFALLAAVTPNGAIAGYGVAAANVKEQRQAETFLAARRRPHPRLPTVGPWAAAYLADAGFAGEANHRRWQATYDAVVVSPPQSNSAHPWPEALADWLRRRRQIAETAFAALLGATRLRADRPHALDGFQARLAAMIARHNFCLWLNRQLGRPPLAFADLIAW
jgi:hypothetical protein